MWLLPSRIYNCKRLEFKSRCKNVAKAISPLQINKNYCLNIKLYGCQNVVELLQGDEESIAGQFFEVSNNEAIQMWNKLPRINFVVNLFSHFFLRVAMKRCSFTFLDNFEHKRSIH